MKDEMDILWDNIVNYAKSNSFNIYYSMDIDIVISFEWDKRMGNVKEFLKGARNNKINSVVLSIKRFEDEDIDCNYFNCKKFSNRIAEIDLIYIMNDVGYKYHEEAKWFTEVNTLTIDDLLGDYDDKKILPLTKEINEKSVDSLSDDMIRYINEEFSNIPDNIDDAIKSFWLYKGINLDFSIENDIKNKMDMVNKKAKKIIDNEKQNDEKNKLYKLIPEIISGLIKRNKYDVNMEDIKNYLAENGIKIKYKSNLNLMYNQLIKDLKDLKIKNDKY